VSPLFLPHFRSIEYPRSKRLTARYSTEEPKSYKRTVIRSRNGEGKGKEKERMYIYPPDLPGQEDPSPMYEGLRTNLPKASRLHDNGSSRGTRWIWRRVGLTCRN
jgi:hypothetical protein